MRFVVGELKHETNVFSSVRTELRSFQERTLFYGEEMFDALRGTRTSIGGILDAAAANNIELVPTVAADAMPSGVVTADAYRFLKQKALDGIKKGGTIDGVLLSLHGSMGAEGVGNAEGDLTSSIRELVGAGVPIVCTLDLHATVTDLLVQSCDALFGYNTNPHVDSYERAVEAVNSCIAIARREIKPVKALRKPPMMPPTINMRTTEGPMVKIFGKAYEMERNTKVVNVNVAGGFPYCDSKESGFSIVVMTNNDSDLAEKYAQELSDYAWSLRREFLKPLTPVSEAVRRAMDAKKGPIVLADVADNPGGGGSGDGTVVLKTLLETHADNVGFALIKDPEVVVRAIETGVGGSMKTAIGGKTDSLHGPPIEVTGYVETVTDGTFVHKGPMGTGSKGHIGRSVVLKVDGVQLIVAELKMAPNDPEIFRRHGIEPTEKKILVVKSRGHFRAAYEPFAKEIIEVDAPGLTSPNLKQFPYKNVRRPLFPLDDI
jgi:microcystin degradation protein MlrC